LATFDEHELSFVPPQRHNRYRLEGTTEAHPSLPAAVPAAFDPANDKYVLVIGHGRSGTNLALDLLDCHPATFCRNEPNEIPGSAMNGLAGNLIGAGMDDQFVGHWRDAIAASSERRGFRDRFRRTYKQYYSTILHALVAEKLQSRTTLRNALGIKGGEWQAAGLKGERVPVFKILLRPHWATVTHSHDRNQHVIHVVREPVAFILSWWNRYVLRDAQGGPQAVYNDNLRTVPKILAHYGARLASGNEYSFEALIETELWRWRYMNEWPMEHLSGSDRYVIWKYSDLNADAPNVALSAFDWLGLALDAGTQHRISTVKNTLFSRSHREILDRELISRLARHVLTGSNRVLQEIGSAG
jgi:hypothetical protein